MTDSSNIMEDYSREALMVDKTVNMNELNIFIYGGNFTLSTSDYKARNQSVTALHKLIQQWSSYRL